MKKHLAALMVYVKLISLVELLSLTMITLLHSLPLFMLDHTKLQENQWLIHVAIRPRLTFTTLGTKIKLEEEKQPHKLSVKGLE